MSTIAVPAARERPAPRPGGPALHRLVLVELRKATDTRAGRWLLVATAAIVVLIAVLGALVGERAERTFGNVLALQALPLGVLLPVVGILMATGEWSQRTALTTFALVPRRGRIVAAKLLAALLLGLGALVVTLAVTALGAVLAATVGDAPDAWDASGTVLAQTALAQELGVLWAMAFGLLLASPAAAIVAYFALPIAFSVVGEVVPGLEGAWEWLDPNRGLEALTDHVIDGRGWASLGVACVLWIGVPLVLGTVRTLRREVK